MEILGLRFDLKTDLKSIFQFKLIEFYENAYFCKYVIFLPT